MDGAADPQQRLAQRALLLLELGQHLLARLVLGLELGQAALELLTHGVGSLSLLELNQCRLQCCLSVCLLGCLCCNIRLSQKIKLRVPSCFVLRDPLPYITHRIVKGSRFGFMLPIFFIAFHIIHQSSVGLHVLLAQKFEVMVGCRMVNPGLAFMERHNDLHLLTAH